MLLFSTIFWGKGLTLQFHFRSFPHCFAFMWNILIQIFQSLIWIYKNRQTTKFLCKNICIQSQRFYNVQQRFHLICCMSTAWKNLVSASFYKQLVTLDWTHVMARLGTEQKQSSFWHYKNLSIGFYLCLGGFLFTKW